MRNFVFVLLVTVCFNIAAQNVRERISFDKDWYFAFGHPFDKSKDYNTGTNYFTYLAKARFGADGAAAIDFDHRAWRPVNLPHDWAVEMPFDAKGSHSHGYKAVGPGFPDVSVGWYRRKFFIPNSDLGKQIFLDFDGVARDAKVWVNGHYLGNEPSGYQSFSFNISDILNYGDENIIAVRADVTMEEGWYYEGAGIYRHVWMRKTNNLHIPKDGSFVHCEVKEDKAIVTIEIEVENRDSEGLNFIVKNKILNAEGKVVAASNSSSLNLAAMEKGKYKSKIELNTPALWSLENPNMHTALTQIIKEGEVVDEYLTPFGIRTIKFDADKGFFLNNKHVKLKGTNNHQDHAGVGCAMPDELIRWRLQQLKSFGCNAIRSSHNPPTPELLSLCDEMGILVINENRLMGTTDKALNELERLIRRDRNHPSVIVWSVGNEEWGIEGNEIGARMTQTMQNYSRIIDPTRPVNVAISGGWGYGSSTTVEIMGYNYLVHGDTDEHYKKFPHQPSIGTEEGSTYTTRGIYIEDDEKHYKTAYDIKPLPDWFTIQECWKHYAERDYLSGMFIWTGFDYRGEPTPYSWPSVTSYFGMMDLCGFPKDNAYYLKSWWQKEPVLHILPHWNWEGREGDTIDVWVYSNCDEVELMLNGKSFGQKKMELNCHLQWGVPYQKGTIEAIGYKGGIKTQVTQKSTTGKPYAIQLKSSKSKLLCNKGDVSMLTVQVLDEQGNFIPTASNEIQFSIQGQGEIIGIGNGNPTSLEKERFIESYKSIELSEVAVNELSDSLSCFNFSNLSKQEKKNLQNLVKQNYKALTVSFNLDEVEEDTKVKWFYRHIAPLQTVCLNGNLLESDIDYNKGEKEFEISHSVLKKGDNNIVILGKPFEPKHQWDHPNKTPGVIQVKYPTEQWKRKLFNGLAQVIVQPKNKGVITFKAECEGLKSAEITLEVGNE